jgi:hypothetical protein
MMILQIEIHGDSLSVIITVKARLLLYLRHFDVFVNAKIKIVLAFDCVLF